MKCTDRLYVNVRVIFFIEASVMSVKMSFVIGRSKLFKSLDEILSLYYTLDVKMFHFTAKLFNFTMMQNLRRP